VTGARSIISPIRLMDGGADILAAQIINHNRAMEGNRAKRPLVRYSLRVCVTSYDELAIQNIAEEERPWAIIMTRAPSQPHFERVKIAAVRRPICPIDE
jgi:hypothetical protein